MAKTNQKQQIINKFEEARRGYEYIMEDLIILEYGFMNKLPNEKLDELKKRGKSIVLPKKAYALRPIVRDSLVYGTGCAKVFWNNGLHLERVSIHDLWVDPNAENIFDVQYVVNRVYTTVETLKSQFGNKKVFKNYVGDFIENDEVRFSDIRDLGGASRIEVYDIYTLENGKWYVSTMLPDYSFVRVKEELKDGLPFVFGIVENQFVVTGEKSVKALGYPVLDLLIPLQEQYTVTTNQQFDAIDKQLNPPFLATKQAGISENTLRSNRKLQY